MPFQLLITYMFRINKLIPVLILLYFTGPSIQSQIKLTVKYLTIQDTSEIIHLLKSAKTLQHSNPDSFLLLVEAAESASIKLKSKPHLMKSLLFKAGYYLEQGKFQKSIEVYQSGRELANELKDEFCIAIANVGISSAYLYLAYYPLAEKHLIEALAYYDKFSNHEGIGNVYLNRTFIKVEQKEYDLALKFSELAYHHYKLAENGIGTARVLSNLCDIHYNLKNYTRAIDYGKEALLQSTLTNQLSLKALIYMNIGESFSALNLNDSALHYFRLSLVAGKQWDESYVLAKCYLGLAALDAKKNNFTAALEKTRKSFHIADQSKLASLKAEISGMMASYYAKTGNFRQAYHYKSIESQIRDSLFNGEKFKVINEIEAIYQNQKKEEIIEALSSEKEIEMLKNQQSKYYIFGLVVFLLFITAGGLLLLRYVRINARHQTIELEQRLLRSQMNPHFIFNAISCIQEYVMHKNPLEASFYLSNFAKLMRSILNNSSKELISLDEEIETLENYLKLQELRFPNKFEYTIQVDDKLETEDLFIPPMLSQPFIENAIQHGVAKLKQEKGKICIQFEVSEGSLLLSITDNGPGLSDVITHSNHVSMATLITKRRINNFKKKYKQLVHFAIIDLESENKGLSGVKVVFKLPVKYGN
jgi:tetratricopeptide (TPR) repeat protein